MGFYDGAVYGMSAREHRRFAVVELLFCLAFLVTLCLRSDEIAVWILAPAALTTVFYLTSFLRGASEE